MKSLYIISAITTILISQAAQADDWTNGFFFKPYVGADYQFTHVDYSDDNGSVLAKSLEGGDAHIGVQVHQNLGFELGYLQTAEATKNNVLGSGLDTKLKLNGYTFDALGYLPVTSDKKLELIGTAGITRLRADLNIPGIGSGSDWETKGRVGGGAQYWLTDNLNVRALVRYQGASFDNNANNAVIGNLGVNLEF